MPRALAFAAFLAVVLGVTAGLHAYVWLRLVRDPALPTAWFRGLTALVLVLFASVPVTFALSRSLPPDRGQTLLLVLFSWIGLLFLLVMWLGVADLARLVVQLGQHLTGRDVDPERRLALARMVAAGVAASAGIAGGAAVASALGPVAVKRVRVALPGLGAPTTIVQLSDIHVGPTIRRDFVERIVAEVNALAPDVVAITGDLADGSPERLGALVAPLAALRAKYGVYFVTGNHEYYSGADAWCAELERLGVQVLRNRHVPIGGATGYVLAGVDDYDAGRHEGTSDVAAAVAGAGKDRPIVLLAHQPRSVHRAAEHGVALVLSGHTHGGQVFPWHVFVRLQQPVVRGLHRFAATQLYVHSGTGYWGPPMRLGAPAEITRLELVPA